MRATITLISMSCAPTCPKGTIRSTFRWNSSNSPFTHLMTDFDCFRDVRCFSLTWSKKPTCFTKFPKCFPSRICSISSAENYWSIFSNRSAIEGLLHTGNEKVPTMYCQNFCLAIFREYSCPRLCSTILVSQTRRYSKMRAVMHTTIILLYNYGHISVS